MCKHKLPSQVSVVLTVANIHNKICQILKPPANAPSRFPRFASLHYRNSGNFFPDLGDRLPVDYRILEIAASRDPGAHMSHMADP